MERKTAHSIDEKERTDDISINDDVTFSGLHLSDLVLKGLHAAGFVRPSPIQLEAIPRGRCGFDLVVQAKSGTGKTCVFTVIALEMISVVAKSTQVLVVAPTREIAVQIAQVINAIGASMTDLRTSTFIGGIDLAQDKAKLKCCHIAVGTPGRLNQLVSLGLLDLGNVRLLILDEADQLLTGQFKESISKLVEYLPPNKQVIATSATFPDEVTEFLDVFMRQPFHVRLDKIAPALLGVQQYVRLLQYHPLPHQNHKIKYCELLYILSNVSFNQCLIFSNSQMRAESVCNQLENNGWPATFLTGGQCQEDRLKAFHALCSYKCRILVSTDLSARGLDSEHVNFVINLDIPKDHATYLHRVGRAGRFGSRGLAITLACEGDEWKSVKAISTIANVDISIIPENWNPSEKNVSIEILQRLSEEECTSWKGKQQKHRASTNITGSKKIELNDNETNLPNEMVSDAKDSQSHKMKCLKNGLETSSKLLYRPNLSNLVEVLNNFFLRLDIDKNSFKFQEILEDCTKQWDIVSKYDTRSITMNSLVNVENIFVEELIFSENTFEDKTGKIKVPSNFNSMEALRQFMNGAAEHQLWPIQDRCLQYFDSSSLSKRNRRAFSEINEQERKFKGLNINSNTGFGNWESVSKKKFVDATSTDKNDRPPSKSSTYSSSQSDLSTKIKPCRSQNYIYNCNSQSSSDDIDSLTAGSSSEETLSYVSDFSLERVYSSPTNDSVISYISSAKKFAEMMNYTQTIGKMSASLAKSYCHTFKPVTKFPYRSSYT